MANDIQTFEDSVKARLKGIVAEMIPEERWDGIVRATVHDFETKDLPGLIKSELTVQYKKAIEQEFAKPEWQCQWVNGQQQASEKLNQLLIEAAPLVLASMLGGAAQQMLYDFQQRIQNLNRY